MSKILVLGAQGSGKSTALGKIPELNIQGLNPEETFIIACTNKGLPFSGWMNDYVREKGQLDSNGFIINIALEGNYYQTNNAFNVASLITLIGNKNDKIKNIVIDDSNYLMQDYYMDNAMKGGYDVFKKIGLFMGRVFSAIEGFNAMDKNVIMLAHYEEYKSKNSDVISYRYKTVGKMVQDYITPEGKFEIVLFASQEMNEQDKTINKFFVTNYDGEFPSKSPVGMFPSTRIPNDLGFVVATVNAYNKGEELPTIPELPVQ